MERRVFLTGASGALIFGSGCTDGFSTDSAAPSSGPQLEGCQFRSGRFDGSGDPITRTIEVESADELDRRCAIEAGTAALSHLDANLPVDLGDEPWIHASISRRSGSYFPTIWVEAWMDSDGNYTLCPDPDFSVTEAVEMLPSEVEILLTVPDDSNTSSEADGKTGDEPYECTHRIRLRAGVSQNV